MKYEAHLNANGDLLTTFTFPGEEIEDLCVGTDKRWMDAKDKANYMPDWFERIGQQYAAHAGRQLTEDELAGLKTATDGAKVTDGVIPKG